MNRQLLSKMRAKRDLEDDYFYNLLINKSFLSGFGIRAKKN